MTELTRERVAESIIALIVRDISSRKGIGDEWDGIDDKTRREIIAKWRTFFAPTPPEPAPKPAEGETRAGYAKRPLAELPEWLEQLANSLLNVYGADHPHCQEESGLRGWAESVRAHLSDFARLERERDAARGRLATAERALLMAPVYMVDSQAGQFQLRFQAALIDAALAARSAEGGDGA